MSLDPPPYIHSLQNNIRARPISWEGAVRSKTISEEQLRKIKNIDKVRREQRKQTIEGDPDGYRVLFLGGQNEQSVFQAAAKRGDIIQYMLVLTGEIIEDISSFTQHLAKQSSVFAPFTPSLKNASNLEDPIPLLTSSVLSHLVAAKLALNDKSTNEVDETLLTLYSYLARLAKNSDSGFQDIVVQNYSVILRSSTARKSFWRQRRETLEPLIEVMRSAAGNAKDTDSTTQGSATSIRSNTDAGLGGGVGLQLLYHILLVLWQLSFDAKLVGNGLQSEYNIIALYGQLLRLSPKEKTTRLLLSTLLNLLSGNRSSLLPAATLARVPTALQSTKSRHLTDPDLLEDLDALIEMLDEYTKTQTTFDEYAAEVESGHLRWSPPHRNATFWRENARNIVEHNQGALPKQLAEILSKDWDEDKQVLAVGCNDVACLVKEVPEKRAALEKYGLKGRVMALMQDREESVRWESLRAVGEWLRYSFD